MGRRLVGSAGTNLTCTSCHDVHGSSNYRLLKDFVNGNPVGGYVGTDGETPNPVVRSTETNYPVVGWLKHHAGSVQMSSYLPNYTSEQQVQRHRSSNDPVGGDIAFAGTHLSISTWCAACHEEYDDHGAAVGSTEFYDYGDYEKGSITGIGGGNMTTPNSVTATGTDSIGNRARHRHPVNISLAAGVGPDRALQQEVITSDVLPLEDGPDADDGPWTTHDYMGCLTCHRAHGTASTMTGWAEARYITNASAVVTWLPGDRAARPEWREPELHQRPPAYQQPRRVRTLPQQVDCGVRPAARPSSSLLDGEAPERSGASLGI